ncbi:DUF4369 domain-containing protein [Mucilaginibacter conchicola]|uniref:DUF4369 domain-containing protein n=1 Tax=Mucilaginibacter conchicola TaxID=2303333 RepID=A0A372NRG7_9SPHI|nr:DUF4369 domain-containing protein [Mucilaginibacter conchicola]RFZ91187.1 DUF4369 domain-containing protein [Mucilaginibacter conchicola]
MKNFFIKFLSATFSILICFELSAFCQRSYIIKGELDPNIRGKVYLLYNRNDQSVIDSSAVYDGRFQFKGATSFPVYATISLNPEWKQEAKRYIHVDFQNFFLENANITLLGTNSLKTSKIKGGKAQEDYIEHGEPLLPLNERMKVLSEEAEQYRKNGNETEFNSVLHQMDELRDKVKMSDSLYILSHPDSYVAYTLWKNKHRGLIDPELNTEFMKFSSAIRKSEEGQKMDAKISLAKKLSQGKPAPDFELIQDNGKSLTLRSLKGKNVLLCFWFRRFLGFDEFAFNLARLNRQLKDKNLAILGVYYDLNPEDDKESWLQTIRDKEFNWLNAADFGGVTSEKGAVSPTAVNYGLSYGTLPQAFLIGPDGKIIARHLNLKDRDLYITIKKMLQ